MTKAKKRAAKKSAGCTICRHGDRALLDAQLRAGRSVRDIERDFEGASKSALERHRRHMGRESSVPLLVAPPAPTGDARADVRARIEASLLAQLAAIEADPHLAPLDKARNLASFATALDKLHPVRVEDLTERDLLRHPRFQAALEVIMKALEPWPAALHAAGAALIAAGQGDRRPPRTPNGGAGEGAPTPTEGSSAAP